MQPGPLLLQAIVALAYLAPINIPVQSMHLVV